MLVYRAVGAAALLVACLLPATAFSMTLDQAIRLALKTNPEILETFENREAVEFELQQARGAWLPTIDLDASAGVRSLNSPSRRSSGIEDELLTPTDAGLTLRQPIYDGGSRNADIARQAARVDAASYLVLDRSERIALAVAREYLEYLLQREIVSLTRRNLAQINSITANIEEKIQNDILTVAEGRVARERQQAARVRMKEAEEAAIEAQTRFERLVGQKLVNAKMPKSWRSSLPKTLGQAIDQAVKNNPRIKFANSDIDAASAGVRSAKSAHLPNIDLEASARHGFDVGGAEGKNTDLQAKVLLKWTLFNGGRDVARVQELIRRTGEAKFKRDISLRDTIELVKSAWNRKLKRADLAKSLKRQASTNAALVKDYRVQFDLDRRSLLDVLGAENARFNSEISARNAAFSAMLAQYEILAAIGTLASSTGHEAPAQAQAYAREELEVRIEDVSTYKRLPSRQVKGQPLHLLKGLQ